MLIVGEVTLKIFLNLVKKNGHYICKTGLLNIIENEFNDLNVEISASFDGF